MGIWNTKLYGNDITSDVRDSYIEYLHKNMSDEDAYNMTYRDYQELIGTDEEPLFWFALADTQWRLGRLSPSVKRKALKFIDDYPNTLLDELDEKKKVSWNNMLNALSAQLSSPTPPSKNVSLPQSFPRNPWNVGDIYAYRFHSKKSKEFELYGKHIVFQKIGEAISYDNMTFSVIQIYNKVFSTCPSISDVINVNILPLVYPPNVEGTPNRIEEYLPSFDWYTKSIMILNKPSDFPENNFVFVGNSQLNNKVYRGNECSDAFWQPTGMEQWIIEYYIKWRNYTYNE